jgi:hypothetical protein
VRVEIDEALDAVPPPAKGKCKLQRWIDDELDSKHPRYEELLATINGSDPEVPGFRTQKQVVELLRHLKFRITYMAIGRHRATPKRCACDS